ncbi:hypothetical protein D3C80_1786590 [compost metagenome]
MFRESYYLAHHAVQQANAPRKAKIRKAQGANQGPFFHVLFDRVERPFGSADCAHGHFLFDGLPGPLSLAGPGQVSLLGTGFFWCPGVLPLGGVILMPFICHLIEWAGSPE